MNIIISHDVDHLFGSDHWLRDFIYPKLWLRSLWSALKKNITWKECFLRIYSCFQKERHRLRQVLEFDKKNGVPSTFFFGMNHGLGMSYYPHEAKQIILDVYNKGFEVGVHGIAFDNQNEMEKEYEVFKYLTGIIPSGIRMHYVRFDEKTFFLENKIGYEYDSTEFDKEQNGTIKPPYQVGKMWEFPLTIMDVYLSQCFEKAKNETINRLEECRKQKLEYVSILFHDYQFDDAYLDMKQWYCWLINYINSSKTDSFISYKDAIRKLEEKNDI